MDTNDLEKQFDGHGAETRSPKEAIPINLSELVNNDQAKDPKRNSVKNSRCVSVDTISPAPDGRRKKKESFKGKSQLVKFRCTTYEKKLLIAKAKLCGLSLSEFLRRAAMEQTTVERLSDEEIEIYQMLAKYHNNFKSIGNMFRKKSPKLTEMVYETAKQIKEHLKRFNK
ncbi:mobilization protein MbpA [Maribacter luteus]|uniref:mobilization protein MbpA n=1 Tax=Maribacter luteus TaxID=2594478 RepID=UPI0024902E55|nr:mobilization protein MbpA [Maribacter luteus]